MEYTLEEKISRYEKKMRLIGEEPLKIEVQNGEAVVVLGEASNSRVVIIPEFVSHLGSGCFVRTKDVCEIKLNHGLRTIGYEAFHSLKKLRYIEIPETVNKIKEKAFMNSGIKEIRLPESLVEVERHLFYGCNDLRAVILPDKLKKINNGAFGRCVSLVKLKIPNTVEMIGKEAFRTCRSLEVLKLPDSLRLLGESAFDGCESLRKISIPGSVKVISKSTFKKCYKLNKITINEGTMQINELAFLECRDVQYIDFPESLKVIGEKAFKYCESLYKVSFRHGIKLIENGAFNYTGLTSVVLPSSVERLGNGVFDGEVKVNWGLEHGVYT